MHSILNSTSRRALLQVSFDPVTLQLRKISGVLCFLPVFLEAPPPCPLHPATTNLSPSYLHPEFTSCFLDSKFFSPSHSRLPHPHPMVFLSTYLFRKGCSFNLPGLLSHPPPNPNSDLCQPTSYTPMASSTRTSSVTENKI